MKILTNNLEVFPITKEITIKSRKNISNGLDLLQIRTILDDHYGNAIFPSMQIFFLVIVTLVEILGIKHFIAKLIQNAIMEKA